MAFEPSPMGDHQRPSKLTFYSSSIRTLNHSLLAGLSFHSHQTMPWPIHLLPKQDGPHPLPTRTHSMNTRAKNTPAKKPFMKTYTSYYQSKHQTTHFKEPSNETKALKGTQWGHGLGINSSCAQQEKKRSSAIPNHNVVGEKWF